MEEKSAWNCPAAHGLEAGLTPHPGRLCDICNRTMRPKSESFACKQCDFDVCKKCMESNPKTNQSNQSNQSNESSESQSEQSKMLDKVFKYVEQAQSYADQTKQGRALGVLPENLAKAPENEQIPTCLADLLRWFKADFFKWTDSPFCETCSVKATKSEGLVQPLEEELRYGANRVESWRCTGCESLLRFPRYSDPVKLLETRHGRCGEWANCFTLLLAALKVQVRLVVDWTDHVWTEVWFNDRWHHCDPCEGCFDAPLMYESGWGKKLSYVVAFSPQEVVDVSARYTRNWPDLLTRRKLSESEFAEIIRAQDLLARSKSGLGLPEWRQEEEAELVSCHVAKHELSQAELCGRTSGSLEWRAERGECGQCHPVLQDVDSLFITGETLATRAGTDKVVQAQLLCGATIQQMGFAQCFDLRPMLAAVEVPPENADAFLSDRGFTAEAWVFVRPEDLHQEAFRNPLISRHGTASGWELRLCQNGGAVFLVTIDGVHIELAAGGTPWSPRWTHVAASFDGRVLRIYISKEPVGELCVPDGHRSPFRGPLCLGRNPAWGDRSSCICLHSARVSARVLNPESFLPSPKPDGSSFL